MTCQKHLRRLAAAGVLLAASCLPASAQIYSWRDGSGALVLSNRKPAEAADVHSYPVRDSADIRVTEPAASDRSDPYDDLIVEQARVNGVRQSLVRAVIQVESAFNPAARSSKGAMGLMQLMPATAREFGVDNPFNPGENVRAGVAYLRRLLDRYDNNEELALAAYNAGPGAVDRHGQRVPPYRQTEDYVSKVNGIAGRTTTPSGPRMRIYRSVEIIDGREVVKYSDRE